MRQSFTRKVKATNTGLLLLVQEERDAVTSAVVYLGEGLVREGRSSHVHLNTGPDIPVSRSFRVKVQEALATSPR